MRVMLIHGAGASPLSWRSFVETTKLSVSPFSYDCTDSFEKIVDLGLKHAEEEKINIVIGHSLGGVVGWHLADLDPNIVSGVSISSPWGGSVYADLVEMSTLGLLPTRFFSNVGFLSQHIADTRARPTRCPWLNLVATRGIINPHTPNDGVLTVKSQESIYASERLLSLRMPYSHGEIIQADETVEVIESFLKTTTRKLVKKAY